MAPEKPNNTSLKVVSAAVVTIAVVLLFIISSVTKAQQKTGIIATTTGTAAAAATPSTTSTATPKSASTAPSTASTSSANSSGYTDGTYSATTDYYVPHGSEEIQVSLTIKNGIVTNSTIQNSEYDGESAMYQESFASEYKSYVVGKKISGLQLSYVAGASDTTQGFDNALAKIRSEAAA